MNICQKITLCLLLKPQTVEDQETTQQSFTVDLVRHLMTSCIQAAVARVQDDAFVNGRSSERIAVLLSCLEQES